MTDPSSLQILGGIDRSGTFYSETLKGIQLAVVSYRPQTGEVADVLPNTASLGTIAEKDLQAYSWAPWDSVNSLPYLKDSYAIVRRALVGLRPPSEANKGASALQKRRSQP